MNDFTKADEEDMSGMADKTTGTFFEILEQIVELSPELQESMPAQSAASEA